MAKGEAFYGEMGIGADVRPEQKIDVKRIKKARKARNNSVFNENETFDLKAAQKEAGGRKSKKINKKEIESKKFEALKQDKVDKPEQTMPKNVTAQELQWWKKRRGVIKLKPDDTMGELPEIKKEGDSVQVEAEGNDIESLRKEELELVEKIQRLPKSHPKEPLSEEKKDILGKLWENRKAQQRIIAGARQIETEPKEAIKTGGHEANGPEIIKSITQEELSAKQDKQPKIFQQQHLTDEYADNLEARQEMEELAKQPSPELKQEFLEKNEEATRSAEEALLTHGEPLIEAQKQLIKKQEKEISEFAIENAKLKEILENAKKVESKLAAMEAEANKQVEQSKNPTLKESIKKYLKDPKVKTAIVFGLVGAGIYTASGGTAPIYFALKTALGYKSLFIPAYLGHGFSTWGTAAAIGGLIGHAAEKLGLMKGEKSDRKKWQESLENIKNAGSEQRPVNEAATETLPEAPAKETEDIKDKTKKDEDEIDVIEGSGGEELTPGEKEEMRKIAGKHGIDIISPSAEVKEEKAGSNVHIKGSYLKNVILPEGSNIDIDKKSIVKEGKESETAEEIQEEIDGLGVFLKAQLSKEKNKDNDNIMVLESTKKDIKRLKNKLEKLKKEEKNDDELLKTGTSQEIFNRNVEKVKDDYKKFEKAKSYAELRKIVEDSKAGLIYRQDANLIPSTYDMYLSLLARNILESQEKSALERIKEVYATGAYGYRPSNTKNVRAFFDKIIELNEARDAKKK